MNELTRYTYHRVFDGYNFLSRTGVMEEIVGCDMELVSAEDYDTLAARVAELERGKEGLQKLSTSQHEYIRSLHKQLATVTAERDAARQEKNQCVIDLYRKLDEKDSQLAARTYIWATARPTEDGWYWWRASIKDHSPEIVCIDTDGELWETRIAESQPVKHMGGEWAGPILEPEEDTHS